jgi:anti-sigma regulatory factor (Ser/Thr protein kinase)
MVEDSGSAAQCLEITRDIAFDRLLTEPLHPGTTTCALRPQADSVKTARDVTRATLTRWGLARLCDDAALVVSELVTNAVRHLARPYAYGERPITLLLMLRPPHVLLAVSDPSDGVPTPKQPDFISEHGRGLYIVETYSDQWGWNPLARGGKAVWALFHYDDV